ncbi:MAG: type II toxin-antitoxin system PemK/MazF family toxin [Cyanobacteria bacterium J06607_15]
MLSIKIAIARLQWQLPAKSLESNILYPLVYELPKNLLPKPSWVKITQIRTLSVKHLGKYLAKIEESDYQQVMQAFNRICR